MTVQVPAQVGRVTWAPAIDLSLEVAMISARQTRHVWQWFGTVVMAVAIVIGSTAVASFMRATLVRADTLGYPWPTDSEAPCEFGSAGGPSCVNPSNANDKYDWGVYDTNHVFHPYRNGYEYRNCTDYVQWKESTLGVSVPSNWGNAGQWYASAPAGEQSTTPKAWDAAVVPPTASNPFGHVAFVEAVSSDGTITVSEYNHDAHGDGDTRTGTASSMGFTEFVDFGVHPAGSPSDNTRIALPSGQQYIWERGVTMAVGVGDAQAYDHEGNTLNSADTNWTLPINNVTLPPYTVLRPVGSNQQYLWTGSLLQSINDGPTSQCLLASFTGSNPTGQLAIVPMGWASSMMQGPAAQCSLGDGIRFTENDTGPQQYVSVRGAALQVGYGDALAYNGENDTTVINMPIGYIQQSIHAPVIPTNTVLRAASSSAQFLWDGSLIHPISDMPTSQCLLIAYPQNGVAVVPPSWTSGRAQGAAQQCSLADGTRFTETAYSGTAQYISVRGVALPVGYSDALAYNAEGDRNVIDMAGGYVENPIHGPTLPADTVLRAATGTQQYFWDSSQLHPIGDPAALACLLSKYPQNGVAVVPPAWEAALTVGTGQTCS